MLKYQGYISYASWVTVSFVLKFANFRYHGKGCGLNKVSLTPLNWPTPNTSTGCKYLGYTSRAVWVVTNFVSKFANFRYMATWVGPSKVRLTPLNWLTLKTLYCVQVSGLYLLCKLSYSQFSVEIRKFSLPWQRGQSQESMTDTFKLADSSYPSWVQAFRLYVSHRLSYSQFCVEMWKYSLPWQQGSVWTVLLTPLNWPTLKTLPQNQTWCGSDDPLQWYGHLKFSNMWDWEVGRSFLNIHIPISHTRLCYVRNAQCKEENRALRWNFCFGYSISCLVKWHHK